MAGFLPNELPAVTPGMPTDNDVIIIQEDGASIVSRIQYVDFMNKGGVNGVCPLGADQIIPSQYIPALAITDVYVVTDIAARDALTVEKGDVVKVSDSDGNGNQQTYIYDGTSFIDIQETSDVISVNNLTGEVSLTTNEVPVSTDKNYVTDAELTKIGNAVVTTDINLGGDTASRPASPVLYSNYFDTTLGKPIWFDGTNWVDSAGATV